SLLFCFASTPILLARASCNLAGSAHPCEFTFLLPKFAESARSCLLQPCLVCSPVRVYFSASQVRRACSLVPHTILPGLLTPKSLLFCFASTPILLARASCNLAGSAHPCEFTFLLPKFAESARSCLLQPCLVCSPVRVYFSASQVRRACSLVPHTILPGLLTPKSLLFCFASTPILLARASCNLAGSAHPCEFTFLLPKFAESARSCLLQPCLVCSPVRVYFSASQVRRACSLVPHTILPGLLTPKSLLFCFASTPILLARASCNLAGSAHPCEFTFLLPKFAESARSCLLQPCLVCSPVRVYFSASQVRRACSLVPHTILPGLLTPKSLLFCFASTPILLARASCNLAGSAHPCEFTFLLPKFAESARSCLLQPCLVCSPVRVYFSASQVRRACSLVPHTILPGLLTPKSLLFCFASTPILLARASCNLAGSAHPCEFTFLLPKFAESARSCLLQPCLVCSPVRVYFSASQVRRACSLVPHTILPGLLTPKSLLFCFASTPILLARASCNLAGSAHPCEFTFLLPKFAESARSCLLQPCLVCSPVRVYFSASQVRRACSLVPHTILPGLLTPKSLLFCFASTPILLARASCNLAGSAHPCEFTFLLPKFAESARSCLLQPCLVCSPVRVYFSASQVRRACSLVPHTILPGLLTPKSLLFCFASTPILLARASCNLAGSAHPCEFTFRLRKFAEPARSCLLQPCWICSLVRVYFSASQVHRACSLVPLATLPVRVYFSASQVRRACSILPIATLPGLLTNASLHLGFASSPSLLARASCNLARYAHPCEFTFLLPKFAESARSCLLQPCQVCSPVRVYFCASQVRRACSIVPLPTLPGMLTRASLLFFFASSPSLLACSSYNLAWSAHLCVPLATLPGLLTRASLHFGFASSPSHLAHASCNLAGSTHPCEFTFRLRKFAEPPRSCLLQPCRVYSPVRVYISASQVRRATSLMPLATLPGLLTRASLHFGFASSPSHLAHASCNLAGSTHPCEFTFRLRKFAEPPRSCLLQPCRVYSPVRVYISASQVRRATSLMPLATLPGLLTRASLHFGFASSPSHLAHASCNLAGSTHPCEFTFRLRKFAEPPRSCLLQPCRVYSPVRVYISASQVRRATSLMPLATLPGLLTRASLHFGFASSPSHLAHASCNLAGSTHPCEFTFRLRKFAEPPRSCLLQPCRVYSPVRVYISASQVRRATSLMPLATLPGLLTRASLHFGFASSPSHLAHASCNLAGSTHPCEFTFRLRKFAEPPRSCLLQPCRVYSPVRVYISASQVRRATSLMPLATLPGLLTRASLHFGFASSPSHLAHASCNLAGSTHPCEFTFRLRKFAEPPRSCLLQPCRVYSPVRVYISASQVRRATSLMPLATLPGLLTRASLHFGFASSPSHLAHASCNLAGSTHPCEFTFRLRKFAEPPRSCLLQPCRVYSPVRVYISASQVRRATSLMPLATLPGLLTRASLHFGFASSPSHLAHASCNLAGSTHPCEFTFRLRKFAEPPRSCLLQPCRVYSPVRVYISASQVRRATSLMPLATLPGLLTRASLHFGFASSPSHLAHASCNLAGSTHPCEFTFRLRKFAEPPRSCLLQPCRVYSPVRVYISASQVRRATSLMPLATLPGLLTRASLHFGFASSPSHLAHASCNLAGSTHPCEFTSLIRKYAEPARWCLIQSFRVCSPMRVYFSASQVRRFCSLVPHTILPGLLTCASLLFYFAGTPSMLAWASYNLAGSAHPCEVTFLLRRYAEHARLGLIQSCRVCSPVRGYFSASQVRRACSLGPHTILPGLLTRARLLFCFAGTPSMLAWASYNLAGSAHPCEVTFLLRRYAEHARLGLIQSCRVCSPVRGYFSASQVRRACSLGPHTILPGLLTRARLLFCFAGTPSMLAWASYNLAGSAHPCEVTFLLRRYAEHARLGLIQSCRVCSPVRGYFSASQVRRACSLGPHTILPGLLTRARLLFCFANSPSLLAGASYNLSGSAHPCEFTFLLRKYADSARSCLIQSCLVCSLVRVYFSTSQVRRACSLGPHTILSGLLTRASLLFYFPSSPSLLARASCNLAWSAHLCEFTFRLRKFAEPARSCLLQPCRVCSPVRVYFSASQVRRACSLGPHTILPGLLTRASLLFCFAGTPSMLAWASYNLAGSAHPCEFTSLIRKFAEPARSCLLQPCQVRRACSLGPHTILPRLLTRASSLFCFAGTPSMLAWASYNLASSAHPCEFTFLLRRYAEHARLGLIQSCLVCSPVRVHFSASQVRRACSLGPHTILPRLLTRASSLFCFAGTPSMLAWASYNLASSAHPCEFTFLLRRYAEHARLGLIQSCLVCSPVRVHFSASQVRRACSLGPHTILPRLLTRASSLFCFAGTPSMLAWASYNLASSAHPCEFTFLLRRYAEHARLGLIQSCLVCSPVRVHFSASQVRRACSLGPHTILPRLLTRASSLFCFAGTPSMLAWASYNLASSAHPCEFTFLLRRYAEHARLGLIQSCLVCSPVRVHFSASQVRRACSLGPHTILPRLLTRASSLFCFAGTPSMLAWASYNLASSAHPCEFTFLLRRYAEHARLGLIQSCLVCSPVRVHFSASQVRRACSLGPHTILPRLLTRASSLFCFAGTPSMLAWASYNLASSAHPCEFTFLLRRYAEHARLGLIQSCLVCSPVRVHFSASQVRRACSLGPHTILPRLLTRASSLFCFAGTPSMLAWASYNLASSAHPCEFTFLLRRYAEHARLGLIQSCLVCSPVRVHFSASQVRRACSLGPHTILPRLLTRASSLFCFAGTPSMLAWASYNLASSAHPCEFTFLLRRYAEHARLGLIQSCLVCSPVRVHFSASQVRRACSLGPHTILPRLLTRASSLFCFAGTPSMLAWASYNLASSAHPCEFTFLLRRYAEHARLGLIQSCLVCSPVRVHFSASQVRRACSLGPHTILPRLLTRASSLFCFAGTPSMLAWASYNLASSAHPCEFTFLLRRYAEHARLGLIQSCLVCSPVRVHFSASQVRRACSLGPHTILPRLLTRASSLFCFAGTPSMLAWASYNLASSAHPCEFTFLLRRYAEHARLGLIQSCLVCSPVRVHFSASQVRRACSLNLAGYAHLCEFTFLPPKFAESARSCLLQPCL
ncbi:hypothetical protein CRG98_038115, partial [Punica granatum]